MCDFIANSIRNGIEMQAKYGVVLRGIAVSGQNQDWQDYGFYMLIYVCRKGDGQIS